LVAKLTAIRLAGRQLLLPQVAFGFGVNGRVGVFLGIRVIRVEGEATKIDLFE